MPELVEINRRLIEVDGGRLSIFRFGPLVEMLVVVAVHGITAAATRGQRSRGHIPDVNHSRSRSAQQAPQSR